MDIIDSNEVSNEETLNASGWEYFNIPIRIRSFLWLKKIDLSNNSLTTISKGVFPFFVEQLDLSNNNIKYVESYAFPLSLIHLDLNKNYITSINLKELSNLESLKINTNLLKNIIFPSKLYSIDVSNNHLVDINTVPNTVAEILCNDNKLTELPDLTYYTNLLLVDCCDNNIKSFPIFPQSVTSININNNRLDVIDVPLPRELIELFASNNNIFAVNTFMSPSLEKLDLSMNRLDQVPNLSTNIKHLDMSCNEIIELDDQDIPMSVEMLNISSNKIRAMPENLIQRPNIIIKTNGNNLENSDAESNCSADSIDSVDCARTFFNENCLFDNSNDNNDNIADLYKSDESDKSNKSDIDVSELNNIIKELDMIGQGEKQSFSPNPRNNDADKDLTHTAVIHHKPYTPNTNTTHASSVHNSTHNYYGSQGHQGYQGYQWPKTYVPPYQYSKNYLSSYNKTRKMNPHLVSILNKKVVSI